MIIKSRVNASVGRYSTGEKDIPDETGLVGTDSTLSRSLTVSTGAILSVLVPSIYTRPRRRRSEKGELIRGRRLG
jgi:hypothetical protein